MNFLSKKIDTLDSFLKDPYKLIEHEIFDSDLSEAQQCNFIEYYLDENNPYYEIANKSQLLKESNNCKVTCDLDSIPPQKIINHFAIETDSTKEQNRIKISTCKWCSACYQKYKTNSCKTDPQEIQNILDSKVYDEKTLKDLEQELEDCIKSRKFHHENCTYREKIANSGIFYLQNDSNMEKGHLDIITHLTGLLNFVRKELVNINKVQSPSKSKKTIVQKPEKPKNILIPEITTEDDCDYNKGLIWDNNKCYKPPSLILTELWKSSDKKLRDCKPGSKYKWDKQMHKCFENVYYKELTKEELEKRERELESERLRREEAIKEKTQIESNRKLEQLSKEEERQKKQISNNIEQLEYLDKIKTLNEINEYKFVQKDDNPLSMNILTGISLDSKFKVVENSNKVEFNLRTIPKTNKKTMMSTLLVNQHIGIISDINMTYVKQDIEKIITIYFTEPGNSLENIVQNNIENIHYKFIRYDSILKDNLFTDIFNIPVSSIIYNDIKKDIEKNVSKLALEKLDTIFNKYYNEVGTLIYYNKLNKNFKNTIAAYSAYDLIIFNLTNVIIEDYDKKEIKYIANKYKLNYYYESNIATLEIYNETKLFAQLKITAEVSDKEIILIPSTDYFTSDKKEYDKFINDKIHQLFPMKEFLLYYITTKLNTTDKSVFFRVNTINNASNKEIDPFSWIFSPLYAFYFPTKIYNSESKTYTELNINFPHIPQNFNVNSFVGFKVIHLNIMDVYQNAKMHDYIDFKLIYNFEHYKTACQMYLMNHSNTRYDSFLLEYFSQRQFSFNDNDKKLIRSYISTLPLYILSSQITFIDKLYNDFLILIINHILQVYDALRYKFDPLFTSEKESLSYKNIICCIIAHEIIPHLNKYFYYLYCPSFWNTIKNNSINKIPTTFKPLNIDTYILNNFNNVQAILNTISYNNENSYTIYGCYLLMKYKDLYRISFNDVKYVQCLINYYAAENGLLTYLICKNIKNYDDKYLTMFNPITSFLIQFPNCSINIENLFVKYYIYGDNIENLINSCKNSPIKNDDLKYLLLSNHPYNINIGKIKIDEFRTYFSKNKILPPNYNNIMLNYSEIKTASDVAVLLKRLDNTQLYTKNNQLVNAIKQHKDIYINGIKNTNIHLTIYFYIIGSSYSLSPVIHTIFIDSCKIIADKHFNDKNLFANFKNYYDIQTLNDSITLCTEIYKKVYLQIKNDPKNVPKSYPNIRTTIVNMVKYLANNSSVSESELVFDDITQYILDGNISDAFTCEIFELIWHLNDKKLYHLIEPTLDFIKDIPLVNIRKKSLEFFAGRPDYKKIYSIISTITNSNKFKVSDDFIIVPNN